MGRTAKIEVSPYDCEDNVWRTKDEKLSRSKDYRITKSGELQVKESVISTGNDLPRHPDPRISGFGAKNSRENVWKKLKFTGTLRCHTQERIIYCTLDEGFIEKSNSFKKHGFYDDALSMYSLI